MIRSTPSCGGCIHTPVYAPLLSFFSALFMISRAACPTWSRHSCLLSLFFARESAQTGVSAPRFAEVFMQRLASLEIGRARVGKECRSQWSAYRGEEIELG